MRIIKISIPLIAGVLGIKFISMIIWATFADILSSISSSSSDFFLEPAYVYIMIVGIISRIPIFIVWALLFVLLMSVATKKESPTFLTILFAALALNFVELLLLHSGLDRIVNSSKHYGWFNINTWRTFPDLSVVASLIMASFVFAGIYFKLYSKNNGS